MNETFTGRLTSVEGNLEYRDNTRRALENVLNNEVSNESIGNWLHEAAIHLGSIAEEYAYKRTKEDHKYTEEGEKKGGAVMFSDGTVRSIIPGEYTETDLTRVDENNKPIERGIVVNAMLINLSDKLLMDPGALGTTELGQLKRFLQFHLDNFPEATKANELREYISQLEKQRLQLSDAKTVAEESLELETLLAE